MRTAGMVAGAAALLALTLATGSPACANHERPSWGYSPFWRGLFDVRPRPYYRPPGVWRPSPQRGRPQVLFGNRQEDLQDEDPGIDAEVGTPVIEYGYRPDPVVPLRDSELSGEPPADPHAAAVLAALKGEDAAAIRVTPESRKAILAFYRERGFAPLWMGPYGVTIPGERILKLLSAAAEEGLEPSDYLPPSLAAFAESLAGLASDPAGLARLELGLTAMALRYARHASGGRIDPSKLTNFHDIKPDGLEPQDILAALARSLHPEEYLTELHPTHPAFAQMREELARLRAATAAGETRSIPPGAILKAGAADPRVPLLRERLNRLGLAAAEPPQEAASQVYDAALAEAVKAYQRQAGIKADGRLTGATLAALNERSGAQRMATLLLNMERVRWLPHELGSRYIVVNQPAFELNLYEDRRLAHRTRVIIGKPNTQTPMFSDELEMVVFNPTWSVPQSIATKEMLPILQRDPSYLARRGFDVVNQQGRRVDSTSVDWWSYGGRAIPFTFRQPPGQSNALGEVKFLFPNRHSVYMHDTPSRGLFSREVRAFSHGCVRVQNARAFAEVILGREGWSADRVGAAIDGGRSQTVHLRTKVPVHLTYFTAWPDETGVVRYRSDIYGRDRVLQRAFEQSRIALR